MSGFILLAWCVRFLHITSAICAIGAPFFIRFALQPSATKTLDDATHQQLRQAVNARWKHFVYLFITLFILTGLYSFFVETRLPNGPGGAPGSLITARWKDFGPEDQRTYQMLFGIKVLCAFVIFFLASALTGRAAAFAPLRTHARITLTLLLLLAALVVICASLMHFLPLHPMVPVPLLP